MKVSFNLNIQRAGAHQHPAPSSEHRQPRRLNSSQAPVISTIAQEQPNSLTLPPPCRPAPRPMGDKFGRTVWTDTDWLPIRRSFDPPTAAFSSSIWLWKWSHFVAETPSDSDQSLTKAGFDRCSEAQTLHQPGVTDSENRVTGYSCAERFGLSWTFTTIFRM